MNRFFTFLSALLCVVGLSAQQFVSRSAENPIIRCGYEEYYEYGTDGWIKIATLQRTYDTDGNLYQQVKTEDALAERRTFMHDAEGRQTSVIIEHDAEGWGEYVGESKITDAYDPIAKDFNVAHTVYRWDPVEYDWVMTDGSNFRDVERNADGNITSIIIKSYFSNVADIVPHTRMQMTYGDDGKAHTYSSQVASYHDVKTGEVTWGKANVYKNIEWEDTDGQLYQDVSSMLIGPNRMKRADLYTGNTHKATLTVAYESGTKNFEAVIDYVAQVRKEVHTYKELDANGSYIETIVTYTDKNEDGELSDDEGKTNYIERHYDERGNELSYIEYVNDVQDAGSKFTYTYDADGNLTEMVGDKWMPTYNEIGLLVSSEYVKAQRIVYSDYQDVNTSVDRALVHDGSLQVYNLHGSLVATSTDNLPAGIYVVRQGGKTFKLMR